MYSHETLALIAQALHDSIQCPRLAYEGKFKSLDLRISGNGSTVLGIVVFQLTRTIVIEHIECNKTREAKTSGTEQKKLESYDYFSTKKKTPKRLDID